MCDCPCPLPSARWAEIGNRSPDAIIRFVAAFLPPTHRNRRPSKQTANHTQPVAFIFSTEIICLAFSYRFKWCIFSAFKRRLNKNKIKFASHLGVHDGGGWATIRMEWERCTKKDKALWRGLRPIWQSLRNGPGGASDPVLPLRKWLKFRRRSKVC